jgi:hypothetical protein
MEVRHWVGPEDRLASPKEPRTAPDDPEAKEEVGNGMRSNSVAEPTFPNDQGLIRKPTESASHPFTMGKAEEE